MMEDLLKEYRSWKKENAPFYEELKEHGSILFDRFQPVFEVLAFIDCEIGASRMEANDDLDKIFSVGLEYINDQFQTCKMYMDTYFAGDFHAFLDYDKVISALLYIEDVRYELSEQGLSPKEEEIDMLVEELELMLEERRTVPDTFFLYVDDVMHTAIGEQEFEFTGIIDIFVDVADTLGLVLDEEEEILIGKDLEGD